MYQVTPEMLDMMWSGAWIAVKFLLWTAAWCLVAGIINKGVGG